MNTPATIRRSKRHGRRRAASAIAAINVTVLALSLGACGFGPSDAEKVAQQFTSALNARAVPTAAEFTTARSDAERAINDIFASLGSDSHFDVANVDSEGDGAKVTIGARWKLGAEPARVDWRYETTAQAVETDDGWKIKWDPAALIPKLAEGGSVSFSRVYPDPAQVVDRADKPILTEQTVTRVVLEPGADAEAAARVLSGVEKDITASSLENNLTEAAGRSITAVTLRASDLAPIKKTLEAIEGVTLAPESRLLFADRELTSPALEGLTEVWTEQRDAAAGWQVEVSDGAGNVESIAGTPAKPVKDIRSTLDLTIQKAAEAAIGSIDEPSAIVAFKPSTGGIVTIAQNDAADATGPIALTGLYPPGSTFKIVTAGAALKAGDVTLDTVVPCPGKATIEGRTLPNDENFDLGDVPLHEAFAKSCNTTFGQLGADLGPQDLTKTAAELGLGVDYVIPGLTTVTGSVPIGEEAIARVEAGIGQGKVTASPFGMALVAASIARGDTPAPMFINDQPGIGDKSPEEFGSTFAEQIRTMMREVITKGTATELVGITGLLGKTGTAEYGAGKAHGWFVGIKGDLAFAVLVTGADSNSPAKLATDRFLRTLG